MAGVIVLAVAAGVGVIAVRAMTAVVAVRAVVVTGAAFACIVVVAALYCVVAGAVLVADGPSRCAVAGPLLATLAVARPSLTIVSVADGPALGAVFRATLTAIARTTLGALSRTRLGAASVRRVVRARKIDVELRVRDGEAGGERGFSLRWGGGREAKRARGTW